MILYHASDVEVKKPMLVASNRMLDFGLGFYTTTNREQAMRFAKSVVAKRGGVPMLNAYEFNESAFENFLVRRFDSPSEAWLDFVAANRTGTYVGVRYGLIMGPVANDDVYATIGLYLQGFMSREADYLVFAAEQYRYAKGLAGAQLVELFDKYGVSKFIIDSFELFRIESEQNMIAAVDEFIERQKIEDRARSL